MIVALDTYEAYCLVTRGSARYSFRCCPTMSASSFAGVKRPFQRGYQPLVGAAFLERSG